MSKRVREILKLIVNGEYLVTLHAQKRMAERKITHVDIKNCAKTGIILRNDDKFKIKGVDDESKKMERRFSRTNSFGLYLF